jgi:uncharacterized membrane protein
MALNVHPIFVHFPIAFLTTYALAEMVKWKTLTSKAYWTIVKGAMLTVGVLGAFVALVTGNLANHAVGNASNAALITMHAGLAGLTTLYFLILFALYLAHLAKMQMSQPHSWIVLADKVYVAVVTSWFGILVGLLGLALITVVGALGGAIVYGPNIDPVVSFVYSLFF